MDRLQHFLNLAAVAPPERDVRHFRTWQRVSVQVQREVRTLAARHFFADESRFAINLNRAFTMVVYSCCQPSYGRRPLDFTYDIAELVKLSTIFRLIGRGMQLQLARISAGIQSDERLKRRFLPVWHADILKAVKNRPRMLIEMLAREAAMINTLIELGAMRDPRTVKRFVKNTEGAARLLGLDSEVLQDLVLRTGAENLIDSRIFEDDDAFAPGSPKPGIGGDEYGDYRRPYSRRQVADAGIVPDIQARG